VRKPKQLIKIAVITQPHGIAGEVKVKFFNKEFDPIAYKNFYLEDKILDISFRGRVKDSAICKISDCDSREIAKSHRGKFLYVAREELPHIEEENEYYIDDLLNLVVINQEKKKIGTIVDIQNFGAGDIVTIEFNNSQLVDFPFREEIFQDIDFINNTVIFINPEII